MKAALVSLISNILLTIIKIVSGVIFKSQVLISDGIHNAGDVAASFAALMSMKVSKQPADKDHPYGHGKAEVIASGIVSMILIFASIFMIYHSFEAFFKPSEKVHSLAIWIAGLSLFWKYILYKYTITISKKTGSKSLAATAYDHLADVYASFAAVIGIGLSLLSDKFPFFLFTYGDPISGIVVSIMILKLAFEIGSEAIEILMEKNMPKEKMREYLSVLDEFDEVKRIDKIRARTHGNYVLVDLRIGVDATLTIQEGHDIIRKLKKTIMERHDDVSEILIHLNPWYPNEEKKGE